ncbi:hypothetical protein GW7_06770, partial [Heterocephalus glaber]
PQPPRVLGLEAWTTMPSLRIILFIYFEMRYCCVTQTGLEFTAVLLPQPPKLASNLQWSSCLSLPKGWDYKCAPLSLARW